MEPQIVEILGRNRLIDELLRAGLEVATPERDRGIDLLVYVDLDKTLTSFIARPIQMKAATLVNFSIDRKYEKFPDLIIAYVCNLAIPEKTVTYALTYREAVEVGDVMGYTKSPSWVEHHSYSTRHFGIKLINCLDQYTMTPERWRKKVIGGMTASGIKQESSQQVIWRNEWK
jgi:hypothetical protein